MSSSGTLAPRRQLPESLGAPLRQLILACEKLDHRLASASKTISQHEAAAVTSSQALADLRAQVDSSQRVIAEQQQQLVGAQREAERQKEQIRLLEALLQDQQQELVDAKARSAQLQQELQRERDARKEEAEGVRRAQVGQQAHPRPSAQPGAPLPAAAPVPTGHLPTAAAPKSTRTPMPGPGGKLASAIRPKGPQGGGREGSAATRPLPDTEARAGLPLAVRMAMQFMQDGAMGAERAVVADSSRSPAGTRDTSAWYWGQGSDEGEPQCAEIKGKSTAWMASEETSSEAMGRPAAAGAGYVAAPQPALPALQTGQTAAEPFLGGWSSPGQQQQLGKPMQQLQQQQQQQGEQQRQQRPVPASAPADTEGTGPSRGRGRSRPSSAGLSSSSTGPITRQRSSSQGGSGLASAATAAAAAGTAAAAGPRHVNAAAKNPARVAASSQGPGKGGSGSRKRELSSATQAPGHHADQAKAKKRLTGRSRGSFSEADLEAWTAANGASAPQVGRLSEGNKRGGKRGGSAGQERRHGGSLSQQGSGEVGREEGSSKGMPGDGQQAQHDPQFRRRYSKRAQALASKQAALKKQ